MKADQPISIKEKLWRFARCLVVKVHLEISQAFRPAKRQRAGVLQDAARNSQVTGKRFAFWTAAALRRFFLTEPM